MSTVAYLLILSAIIIARQTSKGRVMNLTTDLSDAFLAIARGDTAELTEVFSRTGDSATPTIGADIAIANLTSGVTGAVTATAGSLAAGIGKSTIGLQNAAGGLAMNAVLLGTKAKGYRWAATGPDYYDCSGLMWRACQALGYKGVRFTTANLGLLSAFKKISPPATQGPNVIAAGINDIVLWPAGSGGVTGHMGVIYGNDQFYSARSVNSGIGVSKISTFRSTAPRYYRYVGK